MYVAWACFVLGNEPAITLSLSLSLCFVASLAWQTRMHDNENPFFSFSGIKKSKLLLRRRSFFVGRDNKENERRIFLCMFFKVASRALFLFAANANEKS